MSSANRCAASANTSRLGDPGSDALDCRRTAVRAVREQPATSPPPRTAGASTGATAARHRLRSAFAVSGRRPSRAAPVSSCASISSIARLSVVRPVDDCACATGAAKNSDRVIVKADLIQSLDFIVDAGRGNQCIKIANERLRVFGGKDYDNLRASASHSGSERRNSMNAPLQLGRSIAASRGPAIPDGPRALCRQYRAGRCTLRAVRALAACACPYPWH
jgi:hypothetical protein